MFKHLHSAENIPASRRSRVEVRIVSGDAVIGPVAVLRPIVLRGIALVESPDAMCGELRPNGNCLCPDFVLDQAPGKVQSPAMLHITIVDNAHGLVSLSVVGMAIPPSWVRRPATVRYPIVATLWMSVVAETCRPAFDGKLSSDDIL